MDLLQKKQNSSIKEIKSFTMPKLYIGKEWYIGFMAYDPSRGDMRRKKIKLNHIEKIGDRRRYADNLVKRLIPKLESGWNPWIEADMGKHIKRLQRLANTTKSIY